MLRALSGHSQLPRWARDRVEDVFEGLDRFTSESMDRALVGILPNARVARKGARLSDVRQREMTGAAVSRIANHRSPR